VPNEVQITLRLPQDVVDRGEALAQHLAGQAQYAGMRMTTAAALRLGLIHGLAELEKAHGLDPTAPAGKAAAKVSTKRATKRAR
jgi:hypothetical protein